LVPGTGNVLFGADTLTVGTNDLSTSFAATSKGLSPRRQQSWPLHSQPEMGDWSLLFIFAAERLSVAVVASLDANTTIPVAATDFYLGGNLNANFL
jgi:hypothetical protein